MEKSLPHTPNLRRGTLATLALALLTWASWQPPSPPVDAPTNAVTHLRVGGLRDPTQALELAARVRALDGVAECQLSVVTQLAVVRYYPDQLSEADLCRTLSAGGAYAVVRRPAPIEPQTAGASYPGLSHYAATRDRLRYALNVRRLFARI